MIWLKEISWPREARSKESENRLRRVLMDAVEVHTQVEHPNSQ